MLLVVNGGGGDDQFAIADVPAETVGVEQRVQGVAQAVVPKFLRVEGETRRRFDPCLRQSLFIESCGNFIVVVKIIDDVARRPMLAIEFAGIAKNGDELTARLVGWRTLAQEVLQVLQHGQVLHAGIGNGAIET